MIFIWFFTVYERWTCDIHKWFIHFLHEGMGGVWHWISCWSCRFVFATIHGIFKWYASLGNKDCPVAMLFAKIAIQDAFFHGFMYKRLFRFQSGRSHGSATGLQKQDRQQGWCVSTRGQQDIVRDDIAILSGSYWERGEDLNLWPSGYEPDELPGCSTPH